MLSQITSANSSLELLIIRLDGQLTPFNATFWQRVYDELGRLVRVLPQVVVMLHLFKLARQCYERTTSDTSWTQSLIGEILDAMQGFRRQSGRIVVCYSLREERQKEVDRLRLGGLLWSQFMKSLCPQIPDSPPLVSD
ncbi:hypothetical protein WOLCODRAFT_154722 [Wolfiporia cocos MD-104 SS10]|uniref:Uncharacterized protein n=1 Tax=Wolfiporia cocos (strain MD-104) TaxID=742152 RepID=A0A2H3JRB0_WOLCO|nr:hypothetical protein WOLCODRAFT_154722 [Wolfiporia cocos MD-104 SS10]